MKVPMLDIGAQRRRLGSGVDQALTAVLESGAFILGPEVSELEAQLAQRAGVGHAVSCGNGTDAIQLALMALGVGPGDAVFVPTFTFAATAEAVVLVGAEPIFVDVDADTFNIDPDDLVRAAEGYGGDARPRAVVAVDLFGVPADYDALRSIAAEDSWHLVADAAQSFGATAAGRPVGSLADITTTSFFPSKPLGCYGDGGALFTDSAEMNGLLRSLRVHGKGTDKYDNARIGMNSRLDTLQAAVLLEKLRIFDEELTARQRLAEAYNADLAEVVQCPHPSAGVRSAWAQYTIRLRSRDAVASALGACGVQTAVYYPLPLHRAGAYSAFPGSKRELPVADALSGDVLSLPLHPYLTPEQQAAVVRSLGLAMMAT